MIKAKLSYNPFLKQTDIKFNDVPPKINSQIEKYKNVQLGQWIKILPQIFYDEMNGYDFELEFKGSAYDMQKICTSFQDDIQNRNLAKDSVSFKHKYQLVDVNIKYAQLKKLQDWLEKYPVELFDYQNFKITNDVILDDLFNVILVGVDNINLDEKAQLNFTFEKINSADQIPADLSNTPIIIKMLEDNEAINMDILKQLNLRTDVCDEQIFLEFESNTNTQKALRKISDIGIINPYIIKGFSDKKVIEYFENVVMVNYIYQVLFLLSNQKAQINVQFEDKYQLTMDANKEHLFKKKVLEHEIEMLKGAQSKIKSYEQQLFEEYLNLSTTNVLEAIDSWKSRKNNVTGDMTAMNLSQEYTEYIDAKISDFKKAALVIVDEGFSKAIDFFTEQCTKNKLEIIEVFEFENFIDQTDKSTIDPKVLLSFKQEAVNNSDAFINKLSLFKNKDEQIDPQNIYSLSRWRVYAGEILTISIDDYNKQLQLYVTKVLQHMKNYYLTFIDFQITENKNQVKLVNQGLSEKEAKMQHIMQWITDLETQLDQIGEQINE